MGFFGRQMTRQEPFGASFTKRALLGFLFPTPDMQRVERRAAQAIIWGRGTMKEL